MFDWCNPFRACHCGRSEWTPILVTVGAGATFMALAAGIWLALLLTVLVIVSAVGQHRTYLVVAASCTGGTAGLAYLVAGPNFPFVALAASVTAAAFAVMAFVARDPDRLHHATQALAPRQPGAGTAVATLLTAWTRAAAHRAEAKLAARAAQDRPGWAHVGRARYRYPDGPPPRTQPNTVSLPPPAVPLPPIDVTATEGARVRRSA